MPYSRQFMHKKLLWELSDDWLPSPKPVWPSGIMRTKLYLLTMLT